MSEAVRSAWALLEDVPDPEIPVVSIRELGILREVNPLPDGGVEVVLTPTYSGCPAMEQIEDDVRALLARHRLQARVVTRLAPAWTTDWIAAGAREKLRAFGIAPPGPAHPVQPVHVVRRRPIETVPCPRCGLEDTTETSHFGSTACKALYRCLACHEPFDCFKPY